MQPGPYDIAADGCAKRSETSIRHPSRLPASMPDPSAPPSGQLIGRPRVSAWIPDPRYAPRLLLRAAVTWAVLRLGLFIGQAFNAERGQPPLQPLVLKPEAALALVSAVVIAILADARRKREPIFYANLCMGLPWRIGIAAGVAGTAEVCMAAWLRTVMG